MPRKARIKSGEVTYHVMSRSISETNLFKSDEDKSYYLGLLKRYTEKFKCSIYAYCLMDNHVHLFINPKGYDISSFMHSLNTAYVIYFNKKHNRHGHLFQGRFASNIVEEDAYSLTLSAYIHNNPKDIVGYKGSEHEYPYSSYGIYLGIAEDSLELVDKDFILSQFSNKPQKAVEEYKKFVKSMHETEEWNKVDDDIKVAYTANEYRSEKRYIARDIPAEELVAKIIEMLGDYSIKDLKTKYSRKKVEIRAFVTYAMRVLCGYNFKTICQYIGNMSLSGATRLSIKGFELVENDEKYRKVFDTIAA